MVMAETTNLVPSPDQTNRKYALLANVFSVYVLFIFFSDEAVLHLYNILCTILNNILWIIVNNCAQVLCTIVRNYLQY